MSVICPAAAGWCRPRPAAVPLVGPAAPGQLAAAAVLASTSMSRTVAGGSGGSP